MVEDANGGVVLVGGFSTDLFLHGILLHLPHARTQWTELQQQLQVERDYHVAMLVSDSFANCSISAK